MREIKFRGKRVDNGKWVYGNLITKEIGYSYTDNHGEKPVSNCWIIEADGELILNDFSHGCSVKTHERFIQVIPETVGQFTGVIRNKKVYEGDICDTHTRFGKGIVTFESEMFKINGLSLCTFAGRLEVLGNVWDNPELVRGGP